MIHMLKRLLGEGKPIQMVRDTIEQVANVDATVLIQGESGTGKALAARIIHEISPRYNGPFIRFDCGVAAPELMERESLGHRRRRPEETSNPGVFQSATQGTLFLEHVDLLPSSAQSSLIQVLMEGESERVLLAGTVPRADVRVIAATDHDLERVVESGGFREDLYYRLNVVCLKMPPLRERGRDAVMLAEHFLAELCAGWRLPKKHLTPDARAALVRYYWPGNVEELCSRVELAA